MQSKLFEERVTDSGGNRLLNKLEKLNRVGVWAKTFTSILINLPDWNSSKGNFVWKLRGNKYSRVYCQFYYLSQDSTLPTPTTSDATVGAVIGKNDTYRITSTGMPRKINQSGVDGSVGLARLNAFGMLPTPTATDFKGAYSPDAMISKDGIDRANLLRNIYVHSGDNWKNEDGVTSQLSPAFVMEMMGFPIDWTLLPFIK